MTFHIEPATEADYQLTTNWVLGESADHIDYGSDGLERRILSGAFTLLYDKSVVACGGVTDNWGKDAPNRVGTAWLMMAEEVRKYGHDRSQMARLIRRQLHSIVIEAGYNLIECNVDRYDIQAQRFARFLGFRFCGLREQFGPLGQDLILFGLRGKYVRSGNRSSGGTRGGGADQCGSRSAVGAGSSGVGSV